MITLLLLIILQLQGTTRILHNESSHRVIDLNVTDADGDNLEFEIVGGIDRDIFLDLNFTESSLIAFEVAILISRTLIIQRIYQLAVRTTSTKWN